MSDAPTLARTPPQAASPTDGRVIARRRSLPGGRAVIGAFLVVVAAVGTFGAYLSATADPSTAYLVADQDFEIGDVITEDDLVLSGTARVRLVAMDLPEEVAVRAYTSDPASVERLLGQVAVAPVAAGDLLLASQFAEVAAADGGVVLSFSLPTDRALAGQVEAGEVVDLVATFAGVGAVATQTRVVARAVTVLAAGVTSEGLNGGRIVLTVEVADLTAAQAVQHAVDVGQVAVLRGADPGDDALPATTGGTGAGTDGGAVADGRGSDDG